jgi:hypothetical protein
VIRKPRGVAADLVQHANARPPGEPNVRPEMGRLVERVVDRASRLWGEYDRLEAELKVEGAATPEQVRQALNASERNASDAHLLYLAAKLEFAHFERAQEIHEAPMRDDAMAELQAEKAAGERSKQITEADVVGRLCKLFPDVMAESSRRRGEAEMAVKQASRLADLWQQRSYALSGMINRRG